MDPFQKAIPIMPDSNTLRNRASLAWIAASAFRLSVTSR
jgi:hypothetical protein